MPRNVLLVFSDPFCFCCEKNPKWCLNSSGSTFMLYHCNDIFYSLVAFRTQPKKRKNNRIVCFSLAALYWLIIRNLQLINNFYN